MPTRSGKTFSALPSTSSSSSSSSATNAPASPSSAAAAAATAAPNEEPAWPPSRGVAAAEAALKEGGGPLGYSAPCEPEYDFDHPADPESFDWLPEKLRESLKKKYAYVMEVNALNESVEGYKPKEVQSVARFTKLFRHWTGKKHPNPNAFHSYWYHAKMELLDGMRKNEQYEANWMDENEPIEEFDPNVA